MSSINLQIFNEITVGKDNVQNVSFGMCRFKDCLCEICMKNKITNKVGMRLCTSER